MLCLSDVKAFYGNMMAIKGVSLEVNEGEMVCLLGPNGAGKTTLINTVSGLMKGASGSINYRGEEILGTSSKNIVQLGIIQIPEGRHIFPEMSVKENLLMGAYLIKGTRKVKKKLYEIYSVFPILEKREGQKAITLSGGEQQMLALGRGMMSDPSFLLLDEPSLGLAPLVVKKICDILRDLHGRGKTILLVEQNAIIALDLTNRAYVLNNGLIVLKGISSDLIKSTTVIDSYLGEG